MRSAVIVGRPNVGKSSLFNRLAGKKISIVHDQPGVTRDEIFGVCRLSTSPFEIIDTGGIGSDPDPDFSKQTHLAAAAAMDRADVLLLVVDGRQGVTPVDQSLTSRLRSLGKPVIVVVNKIDGEANEALAADFMRLGFSEVCTVSAEHGRGIRDLVDAIEGLLPEEEPAGEPLDESGENLHPARVVILGRPNVGKSSLVNAILGDRRTIVSEIAGTTRDAVDLAFRFDGRNYVLCDTAGMRHRSKHNTSVEVFSVMRSERALRSADLCILVIDATSGVTSHEKKIARQIQESFKPVLIVLNKWDLIEGDGERRELLEEHILEVRRELFFLTYAPVVALSAKTGESVPRLFRAVEKMRQHATRRMGTGELNRYLRECLETHPPPLRSGKRLKLLYATQVESKRPGQFQPPEVVLFVNSAELMQATYLEYITRRIREKWEFPGLPVRIRMRGREHADKSADKHADKS